MFTMREIERPYVLVCSFLVDFVVSVLLEVFSFFFFFFQVHSFRVELILLLGSGDDDAEDNDDVLQSKNPKEPQKDFSMSQLLS